MKNKTKKVTMWALMNYGTVREVCYRRGAAKKAGIEALTGGEPEYRKMIRTGAFTIKKVQVLIP